MSHTDWKEQPGWQQKWAAHQHEAEDLLERKKRYGRIRHEFVEDDFLVIRIELPQVVPNHPWLYRFGLSRKLSPYEVQAELISPTQLQIRGFIQDPLIEPLCGLINSFPDRFEHVLPLYKPANTVEVITIEPYIKDVKVMYAKV